MFLYTKIVCINIFGKKKKLRICVIVHRLMSSFVDGFSYNNMRMVNKFFFLFFSFSNKSISPKNILPKKLYFILHNLLCFSDFSELQMGYSHIYVCMNISVFCYIQVKCESEFGIGERLLQLKKKCDANKSKMNSCEVCDFREIFLIIGMSERKLLNFV